MNDSQLELYEKIQETLTYYKDKIEDIRVELDLQIDNAELSEEKYEKIYSQSFKLYLALEEMFSSI